MLNEALGRTAFRSAVAGMAGDASRGTNDQRPTDNYQQTANGQPERTVGNWMLGVCWLLGVGGWLFPEAGSVATVATGSP